MSLSAYQAAATRAEDPRSTEYRLFAQVTRALMESQSLPDHDIAGRADALDWNRKVWSNLAVDCASEENQLPEALRASIISLSIFISKQSTEALRDRDGVEILIEINRTIMQGLSPQGAG